MGEASDNIKLKAGSIIEISRLQGFTLQTKGKTIILESIVNTLLLIFFIIMQSGVRLSAQFKVK